MRSPSYQTIVTALTEEARTCEGARLGLAALERANASFDRRFGKSGPRLVATLEATSTPALTALAARLSPYERELCDASALDYGVFLGCKAELAQARRAEAAQAPGPRAEELTEEELAGAVARGLDPTLVLAMKVDPTGKAFDEEYKRRKAGKAAPATAAEPIAGTAGAELTALEREGAEARGLEPRLVLLMKVDPTGKLLDEELVRRKSARAK
jgi:hypothetical protein